MQEESLDRNFGLILHDVARLLRTNFDRRVRDLGLTRSQWWVLTHLYREDGLTQTELAELMEIERPSLGRLLDRLEAKNWIRRGNDPTDRRVNRVYLTVDVKPMVREMRQHASDVRQQALGGLSNKQHEQFVDTLLQIKENLLESSASDDAEAATDDAADHADANAGAMHASQRKALAVNAQAATTRARR